MSFICGSILTIIKQIGRKLWSGLKGENFFISPIDEGYKAMKGKEKLAN